MNILRASCFAALLACSAGAAVAQEAYNACGPLENHYGPFDYRTQKVQLRIVEKFHFTPKVEALIRGESGDFVGGDLSYTLATSPNHHRALVALVRFGERTKSSKPPDMTYSIDCYFDRAVRFAPDDSVVRALYGRYLGKNGKSEVAVGQLEEASRLAAENGFSHHNIGLVYFELSMFDKALSEAWLARQMHFEGDELEQMLKRAGKWREPEQPKQ